MIISANFKANHTRKSVASYFTQLSDFIATKETKSEIIVFPPFTTLPETKPKGFKAGAQNGYPAEKGAYTGEICLDQLTDCGVDTILVGHSERRHVLKESQEFIARKFEFFKRHNFTILYCVGEPIEIRQKGIESVMAYIEKQFEGIDTSYTNLVLAYEPVWAIGTGLSATVDDIEEVHMSLRKGLECPILYGGSVNLANCKEILQSPSVDGVLIGGFSLQVEDFCKVIAIAEEIV